VLVFRDVTAEQEAEAAGRDSAALIQVILDTVADGIITLHASGGVIERANVAAERMFGYASAGLIGEKFRELIPELDRDQRNGSIEYYRASDEARAAGLAREVVGRRKYGRTVSAGNHGQRAAGRRRPLLHRSAAGHHGPQAGRRHALQGGRPAAGHFQQRQFFQHRD
jgi:PAS domain S-box-containing protein